MRRLLSFALLLAFSLPLILPALALGQDLESNLPACCRRNGAHHCMMSMQEKAALNHGVQISAQRMHCPSYPAVIPPASKSDLTSPIAASGFAPILLFTTLNVPIENLLSTVLDCSNPKRGPPSSSIF